MNKIPEIGVCISANKNPCLVCKEPCSQPRKSTAKDLKKIFSASAEKEKIDIPFNIIFSSNGKSKNGLSAYYDFRLRRVKHGIPEKLKNNGLNKIGFLMIYKIYKEK